MLVLTDKQKREIAELLEVGFTCYYHFATDKVEKVRDDVYARYRAGEWDELLDKVENNPDAYLAFTKMPSFEAFRVMEDFINTVEDYDLRYDLLDTLQQRKPFANFKRCLDGKETEKYRERWLAFKHKRYMKRVDRILKEYNFQDEHEEEE